MHIFSAVFLWRSRGKLWEFWTEASGGWGLGQEPWAVFWNCPLTPGESGKITELEFTQEIAGRQLFETLFELKGAV